MRVCTRLALMLLPAMVLSGQTYSPVLNPLQTYWAETFCVNPSSGERVGGCPVYFYIHNYFQSNAHFHLNPTQPPVSTFWCSNPGENQCQWSWNWEIGRWGILAVTSTGGAKNVVLLVQPSLVGQAEALITSDGGPVPFVNGYATGYGDLWYSNHPTEWCRVGGTDTFAQFPNHGSTHYNRYMTTDAATKLYNATFLYFAMNPGVNRICVNDMALPFGGKFDIGGNWGSPHLAHDRGTAADVAGPGSSQCVESNCPGGGPPSVVTPAQFVQACISAGAHASSSVAHADHAHCSFMSPALYPH